MSLQRLLLGEKALKGGMGLEGAVALEGEVGHCDRVGESCSYYQVEHKRFHVAVRRGPDFLLDHL